MSKSHDKNCSKQDEFMLHNVIIFPVKDGVQHKLNKRHVGQRSTVAFSVARSSFFGPVHQNTVIKFDVTRLNVGAGYNTHHSGFTAPRSGVYWLSVSLYSNNHPEIDLTVNGGRVASAVATASTASTSLSVNLNRGDVVQVKLTNKHGGAVHCYFPELCVFSGYLIS